MSTHILQHPPFQRGTEIKARTKRRASSVSSWARLHPVKDILVVRRQCMEGTGLPTPDMALPVLVLGTGPPVDFTRHNRGMDLDLGMGLDMGRSPFTGTRSNPIMAGECNRRDDQVEGEWGWLVRRRWV